MSLKLLLGLLRRVFLFPFLLQPSRLVEKLQGGDYEIGRGMDHNPPFSRRKSLCDAV